MIWGYVCVYTIVSFTNMGVWEGVYRSEKGSGHYLQLVSAGALAFVGGVDTVDTTERAGDQLVYQSSPSSSSRPLASPSSYSRVYVTVKSASRDAIQIDTQNLGISGRATTGFGPQPGHQPPSSLSKPIRNNNWRFFILFLPFSPPTTICLQVNWYMCIYYFFYSWNFLQYQHFVFSVYHVYWLF